VPLSAILVQVWVRLSRTPWREIGYVRLMPLLGADPINQAYHYLVGNRAALPGALYAMIVGAGLGEETVFRGYLFERFGKLFGMAHLILR
jgi:membrane protease YdiL (CAAX protease family)